MPPKRKTGPIAPLLHELDPEGDTLLALVNPDPPSVAKRLKQEEHLWIAPTGSIETPITDSIQMRLSLTHLKLASDYFRKMMASSWKESTLKDGFSFSVTAYGWVEEALLIVMRILHGRTTTIPSTVDLEMLAKVAVVVDYYQVHEATHFFTKVWIHNLKEPLPTSLGRSLLLRFMISWVFSDADTFRRLSRIIIRESIDPVDAQELPIPKAIIDALEEKRQDLVSGVISALNSLKVKLSKTENGCSFECSAMTLGALLKGMHTVGLLDPLPTSPFVGYSFRALKENLKTIEEPDYVGIHVFSGYPYSYDRSELRSCSLKAKVNSIIDEQTGKAKGLDLNNFIHESRKRHKVY